MKFLVEHTDTFCGEANYCWVRRHTIEAPEYISNAALVRRAKALIGTTSQRHVTSSYGDTIQLDYPGQCVRTFIVAEQD